MADTKISNLNAATTPLAGTEVLPVVQAGETKKVPVSTFQTALVSGTNIKTINGNTLLGSGDLSISGGSSTLTIQNKTAAYTVVAGDNGTIINCDGTFTISLTAAATLGAGFNCWIWNTSVNSAVTIDPNGAETINGSATLILRNGSGIQLVCNGTNWYTVNNNLRNIAVNARSGDTYPTASGTWGIAISDSANASGSQGIAIGRMSSATGDTSLALGVSTSATSSRATAIGANSSSAASQAVTGSGAMALGGSYASGTDSFAAAVANNTSSYGATGANSVAIGTLAKATSTSSVAIGNTATSTNSYSVAIGGYLPQATERYAVAIGGGGFNLGAIANSAHSVAIGDSASTNGIQGRFAFGMYEAQQGLFMLARSTTDATATALTLGSGSPRNNNQIILPNNSAYAFSGTVVARQQASGGTASAAWKVEGLIRREGTAGTTTLVASTVTAISNVPGWTLALSADTTNGGLAITATGAAATNIRWVATIQTSEVTYA